MKKSVLITALALAIGITLSHGQGATSSTTTSYGLNLKFQPYMDYVQGPGILQVYKPNSKSITTSGNYNALTSEYIRTIYNLFDYNYAGINLTGKYPTTAHILDNTPALIGYYDTNMWYQGTPAKHYKKIVQNVFSNIINGDVATRVPNQGLVKGNSDVVKQYMNSLAMPNLAAYSFGIIADPSILQAQNYQDTKKPYYAFRLGQQAIRDGVLKAYAVEILQLQRQVNWFWNNLNIYCPSWGNNMVALGNIDFDNEETNLSKLQRQTYKEDYLNAPNSTADRIDTEAGVNYLHYTPILMAIQGLQEIGEDMMQQLDGLGNIQCVQLMAQLNQMKISLLQTEIEYAILATQYTRLDNEEKAELQ
ncbi:MAG: hypothetical protein QXV17_12105 [Candidatus Micrarchaeaceae archaeon]